MYIIISNNRVVIQDRHACFAHVYRKDLFVISTLSLWQRVSVSHRVRAITHMYENHEQKYLICQHSLPLCRLAN
jgi:hypothetical protein